jgi:hypothetical protein
MADEDLVPMLPWWRGFKGEIKAVAKHKYDVTGIAKKINDTTIEITELPIHRWTQGYKAELESMIGGEKGDGVIKVGILIFDILCRLLMKPISFRITKSIMTTAMSISLSPWRLKTSRKPKRRA